jgi:hypothetical protein
MRASFGSRRGCLDDRRNAMRASVSCARSESPDISSHTVHECIAQSLKPRDARFCAGCGEADDTAHANRCRRDRKDSAVDACPCTSASIQLRSCNMHLWNAAERSSKACRRPELVSSLAPTQNKPVSTSHCSASSYRNRRVDLKVTRTL